MATTIHDTEIMNLLDANFGAIYLSLGLVSGRTIYSNTGGNRMIGGLSKNYDIYSRPKLIEHISNVFKQMEECTLSEKQLSELTSVRILRQVLSLLKQFEGQVITVHRDKDFDIDDYRKMNGFTTDDADIPISTHINSDSITTSVLAIDSLRNTTFFNTIITCFNKIKRFILL